uniref:Zinc finger protein n=1 Tax=Loa loa TaxID=7209 RepID=A0A1I7V6Z4_LOALO
MNNHAAIPNAEIDGEIATVLDDAIRLPEIQPEHQHDSLIPTSDLKAKHELEHSPDGVGQVAVLADVDVDVVAAKNHVVVVHVPLAPQLQHAAKHVANNAASRHVADVVVVTEEVAMVMDAKSSRRRANDRIPVKKTIKVSIDVVNF